MKEFCIFTHDMDYIVTIESTTPHAAAREFIQDQYGNHIPTFLEGMQVIVEDLDNGDILEYIIRINEEINFSVVMK